MRALLLVAVLLTAASPFPGFAQNYTKLNASAMAFNPADGYLYAIGDQGTGLQIMRIDPSTGQVVAATDGSGLSRLTMSPTGDALFFFRYVDGTIVRFHLPDLIVDGQFNVPYPPGETPICSYGSCLNFTGLAISPTDRNVFVVSASGTRSNYVGLFQGGTLLPDLVSGFAAVQFLSPTEVLAVRGETCTAQCSPISATFQKLTVEANGLHTSGAASPQMLSAVSNALWAMSPQVFNDRIYTDTGLVVDVNSWQPLGRMAQGTAPPFAIDDTAHVSYKPYGRDNSPDGYGKTLIGVFSLDTFQLAGTLSFRSSEPDAIALCGPVLAVMDAYFGLILLPLSSVVPVHQDPPAPQNWNQDGVTAVALLTSGMALDPRRGALYVTTPGKAGAYGNSLIALDAPTLQFRRSLAVGSEPNRVAMTDSGQTLWVGIDGTGSAAAVGLDDFSVKGNTPLLDPVSAMLLPAVSIAVPRGVEDTLVVCRQGKDGQPTQTAVAYSGGQPVSQALATGCWSVLRGDMSESVLVSVNHDLNSAGDDTTLERLHVNSQGITGTDQHGFTFSGFPAGTVGDTFYTGAVEFWKFGNPHRQGLVREGGIPILSPDGAHLYLVGLGFITCVAADTLLLESEYSFEVPGGNQAMFGQLEVAADDMAIYLRLDAYLLRVPIGLLKPIPVQSVVPKTPFDNVSAIPAAVGGFAVLPDSNTLLFTLDNDSPGTGGRLGYWNTDTNEIRLSDFVGGMPRTIGLTQDGSEAWVEEYAWQNVRRFSLPGLTPLEDIYWMDPSGEGVGGYNNPVTGIQAVPGTAKSMTIAGRVLGLGTMIFDVAGSVSVERPAGTSSANVGEFIDRGVFSTAGDRFYAFGDCQGCFYPFSVDKSGFHPMSGASGLANVVDLYDGNLRFVDGSLYSGCGRVIDPQSFTVTANYPLRTAAPDFMISCQPQTWGASLVLPDIDAGVVYYLTPGNPDASPLALELAAFDLKTYSFIGKMTVAWYELYFPPVQMAKVGAKIAFLTGTGMLGVADPSPMLGGRGQ